MDAETTLDTGSIDTPADTESTRAATQFAGPDRRAQQAYAGPDRRSFTWKTLYYGMIKPRRHNVRRTADAPNAYVDFHAPHLLAVATIILVFSMLDGVIAVHLASMGAIELNPAMAALIERDAVQFAIAKWLLTAAAVVALIIAERAQIFGRIRAVFFLYGIMIGYGALVGWSLFIAITMT